jgi:hypothetical protein
MGARCLLGAVCSLGAVSCESAPDESDLRAVTSASLAGPGHTEIAKADEDYIGPTAASEKPSSPITSRRQWTSHLEYCDLGFRSSGDAALDVVRLGALCGYSNGLTKGSAWTLRFDTAARSEPEVAATAQADVAPIEPTGDRNHAWVGSVRGKQELSSCGRLTIGLSGVHQRGVHVELRRARAAEPLFTCQLSYSGFCPERELACDVSEVHVAPLEVDDEPQPVDGSVDARTDGHGLSVRLEWWALPTGSDARLRNALDLQSK